VRDASEALSVDPANLFALNARATALFQLQDPRWMQDAQAIMSHPPRSPADRVFRARAFLAVQRPHEAMAETNAALEADPANSLALALRGSIHANAQRFDDALRDAHAALAVNPRNPVALLVRAQASLMTGNPQQAARDAVEILRFQPADPVAGNILDVARNPWKLSMMRMGLAARNWLQPSPSAPAGSQPFPPPPSRG
jgi:predicted Zn-dependent protease